MLDHSRDDFAGQRDRLILELLYSTGCRVSEACGIKLEDIEVRKGRIRVMGKGSKERFTYLGDAAKTALTEYLAVRTGLLNRLGSCGFRAASFYQHQRIRIERPFCTGHCKEGGRKGRGGQTGFTPYSAAQLCHPSGGRRCGHSFGAGAAGPFLLEGHPGLYPCRTGPAAEGSFGGTPSRDTAGPHKER